MTVVERKPAVAGQQSQQKEVLEPKTFAEKMAFLKEVARRYLDGKITWDEKWYYTQRYGPGTQEK